MNMVKIIKIFIVLTLVSLHYACHSQKNEAIATESVLTTSQTDSSNAKLAAPLASVELSTKTPEVPVKKATAQPRETSISIIGVGDIMLGTNYPSSNYLPPNKGKGLLAAVNDTLKAADITFGNLEGTILNRGATIKNCAKCYAFRMPEYLAENLVTAGFDVVSIANNHIRDFGQKGINNTIKVLKKHGINTAGVEQLPSVTFEKNGVKYGFVAFAPNIGTISINDIPKAKQIVKQLAKTSDIVIISFHGGAEGATHQQVPKKNEYFYGENRGNVHKFAHSLIDAGADIIFGHGPHVTRAIEVYKDRFIAYSLGNFCTYGRFNLRGVKGFAPIIKVKVKKDGSFEEAQIISVKQVGRGIVKKDPSKQALKKIKSLTKADGFLKNLKIENNGKISQL
jgi:hypothetical protein